MNAIVNNHIIKIIAIFGILFLFGSCYQVSLKLDKVPANTPKGAQIFVSGNFNFWDPGDNRYIMDYDKTKGYSITLPASFGNIEYKFTRGDWSTVERDRCGNDISNRIIDPYEDKNVIDKIESWADLEPLDCDSVTITVNSIPKNTPKNAEIKVAGNFNAWNPANDPQYLLKKDSVSGNYTATLKKKPGIPIKDFRFKIVRANINQSESDRFGNEIEMRKIDMAKGENLNIEVENWIDLAEPSLNSVSIVLTKIPKTTPQNSQLFLTGNFNNWNPGDRKYLFRNFGNGIYGISIPRQKYGLSFKVTRGTWNSEAADREGNNLENQDYNYSEIDTIYMAIENWKDIDAMRSEYFTIVIDKIPTNTPVSDNLYLACNYNKWQTNNSQYIFSKDAKGRFILNVKRKDENLEFKIVRGSWKNQELTTFESRTAHEFDDTIKVQITNWSDFLKDKKDFVRIEIEKLPKKTTANDEIYIAGGFNGWNPGEKNFKLNKSTSGTYYIELPRLWLRQGFKFTRGSWKSVETGWMGNFVENRIYNGNDQILKVKIVDWEN